MAFGAALIGSFRVAFPAPLIVSGQPAAAASLGFIKLCQVMEPAHTHHRKKFLSLHYLTLLVKKKKKKTNKERKVQEE